MVSWRKTILGLIEERRRSRFLSLAKPPKTAQIEGEKDHHEPVLRGDSAVKTLKEGENPGE